MAFAINAQGPENLGEFSKKFGKKIIHISTDYVFDGAAHTPYKETDRCHPINVYGKSKWLGEKKLLEKNPNACIIRSSWLFGKGGKNFVSSIFQLLKEKETLRVITDQKGRPTFCPDLARVILSMLDQSGIFHFANLGARSRFEIAQDVLSTARALGIKMACTTLVPVLSAEFPTPAKRPAYSVLNTDKIENATCKPRTWEEVLKEYVYAI
jgi:dTDP-4-dehydrorhamnose reductase